MDEDPVENCAPRTKISPSAPEHEKFILQGTIARSHAAIQESREDPHCRNKIPLGAEKEFIQLSQSYSDVFSTKLTWRPTRAILPVRIPLREQASTHKEKAGRYPPKKKQGFFLSTCQALADEKLVKKSQLR